MDYFELIKGFLLSPVETFQKVRSADLGDALKYYLVIVVINAVLSAIVGLLMVSAIWAMFAPIFEQIGIPFTLAAGAGVVVFAILMIFVQLLMLFIGAAWLHIFVYLLGGRKGYLQTLKAISYGSTPSMLIGWIPFIGIIGAIWSFILGILGIRELQAMSTGRAAGAVILAMIIILIIIILIIAVFAIAFSEIVPMPINTF
ncbi:MAG: YIP1 family protein [Methanoregulaceae archaeon]|nr:YIP1 family protein [Methanoregulaceae archaeon]